MNIGMAEFDGSVVVPLDENGDGPQIASFSRKPIEIGPWWRNCMNRPLEIVISDAEWVGIRMQQEHNKHKN